MGMFFLTITFVLVVVAIASTSDKKVDNTYKRYHDKMIKYQKKILISGVISLISISCVVILYTSDIVSSNLAGILIAISTVVYIFSFLAFLGYWMSVPNKQIAERDTKIDKINDELKQFKFDREISGSHYIVSFDNTHKLLVLRDTDINSVDYIKYTDLLKCEVLENNTAITKGGLGRAVVGGAIAGGVGAIVGANTRKSEIITDLKLNIITKNINKSSYLIWIKETQIDDQEIKFINEVYGVITTIIEQYKIEDKVVKNEINPQSNKKVNNEDIIEQFEKLDILKNKGMITEEEYNEKRKVLLNRI